MSSEHAFQLDAALRIRLLLVDDEPDFKEVMLKHLSRKGIRLSVAECCLDALDLLDTTPADVIIMDMNMPGMDGIQCLRQVKERWPLTEVIILTGHASVQSGIEGVYDQHTYIHEKRQALAKVESVIRSLLAVSE